MFGIKGGSFLVLLLTLVGCGNAAGPAVPESDFRFEAQNEITQAGTDGANAQVAVQFTVSVPSSVDATDLAKIQTVDVLWPNNYVRTPILSGFQVDGDSAKATRFLPDRTDGLTQGMYTMEVTFLDGQTVMKQRYCDGAILPGPTITTLTADSAGVSIRWRAPSMFHTWEIHLERTQPAPATVVATGGTGSANGGTLGAGFDYAFQPNEAYDLVMVMENDCNHRTIRIPVP